MKMHSLSTASVGCESYRVTSTAKGGCPKQRTDHSPSESWYSSGRLGETMLDVLSCGLMEERYGIQEEGIF